MARYKVVNEQPGLWTIYEERTRIRNSFFGKKKEFYWYSMTHCNSEAAAESYVRAYQEYDKKRKDHNDAVAAHVKTEKIYE